MSVASVSADKQVFPKLDVVGWYATGNRQHPGDVAMHRRVRQRLRRACAASHICCATPEQSHSDKTQHVSVNACGTVEMPCVVCRKLMRAQVMALNESPVFMLLDPEPRPGDRELPVKLFESGAAAAPELSLSDKRIVPADGRLERGVPASAVRYAARAIVLAQVHFATSPAAEFTLVPALTYGTGQCDALTIRLPGDAAEVRVVDGVPTFAFVQAKFTIEVISCFALLLPLNDLPLP